MHDPKESFPQLRIIGLTGPIGSGCSTLSHFFDKHGGHRENSKILEFLGNSEVLDDSNQPKLGLAWDVINQGVYNHFKKKEEQSDDEKSSDRTKLKDALEQREAYRALEFLQPYFGVKGHLFRTLSMSDLIVFHAILTLEKKDYRLDKIAGNYRKLAGIIRTNVEKREKILDKIGISKFSTLYDDLQRDMCPDEYDRFVMKFGILHGLASRIKQDFREKHTKGYIKILQDLGNNLRKTGNPFDSSSRVEIKNSALLARDITQICRLFYKTKIAAFFIIDCIRNPYEAIYLRNEFANFTLISLYAGVGKRKERFLSPNNSWVERLGEDVAPELFKAADTRDSGDEIKRPEGSLYMQKVPECVKISDIAINNESTKDDLYKKIIRYLCLILSPGCTKPGTDEVFMNMAYTMAMKSNCVCRQVGAIVVGKQGFVIGAGWNDVGSHNKISCGHRVIEDLHQCEEQFTPLIKALGFDNANKCRKYLLGRMKTQVGDSTISTEQFSFCFKDIMTMITSVPKMQRALESFISEIPKEKQIIPESHMKPFTEYMAKELVNRGNLHQLEFCLALHAEENAILQSSRIGGVGLEGATLYSTAQPCTLCAKKTHQVGIKKVVYTEPYPKAHSDLYMPGVTISQFEGVKPRSYIRLFMPHHDQKEWQILQAKKLVPKA